MMDDEVYKQLLIESIEALEPLAAGCGALIGESEVAGRLNRDIQVAGVGDRLAGFFSDDAPQGWSGDALRSLPLESLRDADLGAVVVAADAEKEVHLSAAARYIAGAPRVVIAGYAHFDFRDPLYLAEVSRLEQPSLANGYPNSRIHLYQCLVNAARLGLDGVVVEFGMFRGGTTMFMSRVIEQLGQDWPVMGFDTFEGFPARGSMLDMYDHDDLREVDLDEVTSYFADRNVRVVPGDIRETVEELAGSSVVVAFVDTDNFTPAKAAIEALVDRIPLGGAIVFDHLTGVDRFKYTLGERMAAQPIFDDRRFFNLHGTGVFIRQCGGNRAETVALGGLA